MKRHVDYTWRLQQVMAMHGMFATTELVQPLRDRGIDLSVSQVHRPTRHAANLLNLTRF